MANQGQVIRQQPQAQMHFAQSTQPGNSKNPQQPIPLQHDGKLQCQTHGAASSYPISIPSLKQACLKTNANPVVARPATMGMTRIGALQEQLVRQRMLAHNQLFGSTQFQNIDMVNGSICNSLPLSSFVNTTPKGSRARALTPVANGSVMHAPNFYSDHAFRRHGPLHHNEPSIAGYGSSITPMGATRKMQSSIAASSGDISNIAQRVQEWRTQLETSKRHVAMWEDTIDLHMSKQRPPGYSYERAYIPQRSTSGPTVVSCAKSSRESANECSLTSGGTLHQNPHENRKIIKALETPGKKVKANWRELRQQQRLRLQHQRLFRQQRNAAAGSSPNVNTQKLRLNRRTSVTDVEVSDTISGRGCSATSSDGASSAATYSRRSASQASPSTRKGTNLSAVVTTHTNNPPSPVKYRGPPRSQTGALSPYNSGASGSASASSPFSRKGLSSTVVQRSSRRVIGTKKVTTKTEVAGTVSVSSSRFTNEQSASTGGSKWKPRKALWSPGGHSGNASPGCVNTSSRSRSSSCLTSSERCSDSVSSQTASPSIMYRNRALSGIQRNRGGTVCNQLRRGTLKKGPRLFKSDGEICESSSAFPAWSSDSDASSPCKSGSTRSTAQADTVPRTGSTQKALVELQENENHNMDHDHTQQHEPCPPELLKIQLHNMEMKNDEHVRSKEHSHLLESIAKEGNGAEGIVSGTTISTSMQAGRPHRMCGLTGSNGVPGNFSAVSKEYNLRSSIGAENPAAAMQTYTPSATGSAILDISRLRHHQEQLLYEQRRQDWRLMESKIATFHSCSGAEAHGLGCQEISGVNQHRTFETGDDTKASETHSVEGKVTLASIPILSSNGGVNAHFQGQETRITVTNGNICADDMITRLPHLCRPHSLVAHGQNSLQPWHSGSNSSQGQSSRQLSLQEVNKCRDTAESAGVTPKCGGLESKLMSENAEKVLIESTTDMDLSCTRSNAAAFEASTKDSGVIVDGKVNNIDFIAGALKELTKKDQEVYAVCHNPNRPNEPLKAASAKGHTLSTLARHILQSQAIPQSRNHPEGSAEFDAFCSYLWLERVATQEEEARRNYIRMQQGIPNGFTACAALCQQEIQDVAADNVIAGKLEESPWMQEQQYKNNDTKSWSISDLFGWSSKKQGHGISPTHKIGRTPVAPGRPIPASHINVSASEQGPHRPYRTESGGNFVALQQDVHQLSFQHQPQQKEGIPLLPQLANQSQAEKEVCQSQVREVVQQQVQNQVLQLQAQQQAMQRHAIERLVLQQQAQQHALQQQEALFQKQILQQNVFQRQVCQQKTGQSTETGCVNGVSMQTVPTSLAQAHWLDAQDLKTPLSSAQAYQQQQRPLMQHGVVCRHNMGMDAGVDQSKLQVTQGGAHPQLVRSISNQQVQGKNLPTVFGMHADLSLLNPSTAALWVRSSGQQNTDVSVSPTTVMEANAQVGQVNQSLVPLNIAEKASWASAAGKTSAMLVAGAVVEAKDRQTALSHSIAVPPRSGLL